METVLSNPWAAVGAILLACLAAHLTYRNNRLNRRAAAAAEFRSAFSEELVSLQGPVPPELPELLLAAFPRHSVAFEKFRHHLPSLRRRKLEKSWREYHSGHQFDADQFEVPKEDQLFLEYYAFVPNEPDKAVKLAKDRIDALLSCAKET